MKITKRIIPAVLALMLFIVPCFQASAETIYEYYGYSYTIVNNREVSIVDWDFRTTDLTIIDTINERNVISVANYAFSGNTLLTGLDLTKTDKLNRIGTNAFLDCVNLSGELVIPSSVALIGSRAFEGCTSLETVNFENGLTEIPSQCFYKDASLSEVVLPQSLEKIQPWAFADCVSLEYVEIPENVSYIAKSAFSGDNNLTLGVYYNSYAHRYAIDNNIPYVLLDSYLRGDANQDGRVDVRDVTKMQRYKAEMEQLNDAQFRSADVNIDCDVTMADVTLLQRHLAEFEDAFW